MARKRDYLQIAGSLSSVASIVLSTVTLLMVQRLDKFYRDIAPLEMEISISSPTSGSRAPNSIIPIEGDIVIGCRSSLDVNLYLAEHDIDIVSLVRPLSEGGRWRVQTRPAINRQGHIQGSVNIGNAQKYDTIFHIIMIAVPHRSITAGELLGDLPPYGAVSGIVEVTRTTSPRTYNLNQ